MIYSVFCDSSGILFIDYLEKGKTINSDYYCALLNRLKEEITRKQPQLLKENCIFLQDNVLAYKLIKTIAKINNQSKNQFSSNEEVKWEADGYFGGFNISYYKRGIELIVSS